MSREIIREIWALKAALEACLPAHDAHLPNGCLLDVALDRGIKGDRQSVS